MYNFNDYIDDGVERRPSNLDRDAKLNYQSQINTKKRVKDKIETLNSGVFHGGQFNKQKLLNGNNLLPSPRFDYFDNTNKSNDNFVSQSNIEFTRKYEIEEIKPQQIHDKLRNAGKKSKVQYFNEGYQKDEFVNENNREKFIAKLDNSQFENNNVNRNKSVSKVRVPRYNEDEEQNDEIEDLTEHQSQVPNRRASRKSSKNEFISNSEIIGNNHEEGGAIAPIDSFPTNRNNTDNKLKNKNNEPEIDYSIFELLNNKDSVDFILKPAPIGLVIKCQIYRNKGLYPEYKMCLQREDASLILILSAKKRKRTKTPSYLINTFTFENNSKPGCEIPYAKLKSNLIGTQFTLYDAGNDTDSVSVKNGNSFKKEYVSIIYGLNVLGFKGPRQMKVLIPGMDENYKRKDIIPKNDSETIIQTWKKVENIIENSMKSRAGSKLNIISESQSEATIEINNDTYGDITSQSGNIIRLANKSPVWNPTLKSFALNFNGRVTQASVKNFQIIHPVDIEYIVMQFGKVSKDVYTCDYSYPLCALQAFGVALSSLDNKLACD